jgi:hypothetical protein
MQTPIFGHFSPPQSQNFTCWCPIWVSGIKQLLNDPNFEGPALGRTVLELATSLGCAAAETAGHKLGPSLRVYVRIGTGTGVKLDVPYNPLTGRYQIEIWGYGGNDLRNKLGEKGQAAFDRGGLIANPALVQGSYADFAREGLDNRDMRTVAPNNIMHPVLPLAIELAWADKTETWWDSRSGANYHHRWIIYRGWDNYLQVGISEAPHGGFGFLHFRNVLSNYFAFRRRFSSFDRNRHHGHRRLVPVPGPRALLRDQDHDGRQLQPA